MRGKNVRREVLKVSNNRLVGMKVLLKEIIDNLKYLVMSSVVSPELESHWTVTQDME